MAVALTAREITKTFGTRTLFTGVAMSVEEGERLALIGPNGAGKSTLLKILAGIEHADTGEITLRKGLSVAYVAQRDDFDDEATVLTAVAGGLHLAGVAHIHDEHEAELEAQLTLSRMGVENVDQLVKTLSGGQRKRVAIARELVKSPDLLLLDEPTNHLDIEGIAWLEELLRQGSFASVVVTHDRAFLESVATRIVELSSAYPKGTFGVSGNYSEFLQRKMEFLDAQAKQEASLANQVREDLRWLSRGAQARRTKSKSRIGASFERMDELAELKSRNAPAKAAQIDWSATGRLTQKLIVARSISKALGGKALFTDVDLVVSPKMILGLLGPNGSGKSTLIKVLNREMEPDPATATALEAAERAVDVPPGTPAPGTLRWADKLRIVLFSQIRDDFDESITLREALSPQTDAVVFQGRSIHINTWARRFLFTAEQLKQPIRALSGGEKARIHIARLMLEPADVLILDEPTNDLDIPSLEVLEDSLEEFPGAVVLVTHDRAMLADLSTHILALDGLGGARMYTDYEQWERAMRAAAKAGTKAGQKGKGEGAKADGMKAESAGEAGKSGGSGGKAGPSKKKLSFSEQRELAAMESGIAKAEEAAAALNAKLADPVVAGDHQRMQAVCAELGEVQQRITAMYARWEELEAKVG